MTQENQIFAHLKRKGSINPMQALRLYGCFRLAARIYDLTRKGHEIKSHMVTRNGKRYAIYTYHSRVAA